MRYSQGNGLDLIEQYRPYDVWLWLPVHSVDPIDLGQGVKERFQAPRGRQCESLVSRLNRRGCLAGLSLRADYQHFGQKRRNVKLQSVH